MKAILINVQDETVRQVEVDDKRVLKDWYKHIGCHVTETAVNFFDEGDCVMVDEEGMFTMNDESKFFTIVGGHQPFVGNGLVVGFDVMNGKSVDHHMCVEKVRSMVKFHTMREVTRMV